MDDTRRRRLVDAPRLKELVEYSAGQVTFAELAEALAAVDVSGGPPEWQEEWAELVDALRRAAEREEGATKAGPGDPC